MRSFVVLGLSGLCACAGADPQPLSFREIEWQSHPTDDELLAAIVGEGGTDRTRADVAAIATDLLVPRLRISDLAKLQWRYELIAGRYRRELQDGKSEAFLRTAIDEETSAIVDVATPLAMAQLHYRLFPDEPFPETWSPGADVDISTIAYKAGRLYLRMKEIEERYGRRLPTILGYRDWDDVTYESEDYNEFRSVERARNRIHIALTGDCSIVPVEMMDAAWRHGCHAREFILDHPPY